MSDLAEQAKRLWSASFYVRRGHDRDRSIAIAILKQLTLNATGKVQNRAALMLKEIDGEQSDSP